MAAGRLVSLNDITSFFQQRSETENRDNGYYQRCIDAVEGHWSQYRTAEEARVAEEARARGAMSREERQLRTRLAQVGPPELEQVLRERPRRRGREEAEQAAAAVPPVPTAAAARPRRGPKARGAAVAAEEEERPAAAMPRAREQRVRRALGQFETMAKEMQQDFRQLPQDIRDVILERLPLESRMFFENLNGVEQYARDVVRGAAAQRIRILGQKKKDSIDTITQRTMLGSTLKTLALVQHGIREMLNRVNPLLQDAVGLDEINTIVDETLPAWINPRIMEIGYLTDASGRLQSPMAYPSEDILAQINVYNAAYDDFSDLVQPVQEQLLSSIVDIATATAPAVDNVTQEATDALEGVLLQDIQPNTVASITENDYRRLSSNFEIVDPFAAQEPSPPPSPMSVSPSVAPPSPYAGEAGAQEMDLRGASEEEEEGGGTAEEDGPEPADSALAIAHNLELVGETNVFRTVQDVALNESRNPVGVRTPEDRWIHPYGYAGAPQSYDTKRIVGDPFWSIQDIRSVLSYLMGSANVQAMPDIQQKQLFSDIYRQTTGRFDFKYTADKLAAGWSLMVNMARANTNTQESVRLIDDALQTVGGGQASDAIAVLRTIFAGALRYIGKQDGNGRPNGIRIFDATDEVDLRTWLQTRGGQQAHRQQGRAFYKLCGSVEADAYVEGNLTIQPVITEDIILNMVSQPARRAVGFRVYFAVTDDADQELLGFLQTADLAKHSYAVAQGEAPPIYLRLSTNDKAFNGPDQLPLFEEDEDLRGKDTRVVLSNNRDNRLAKSLFIDYICTKTQELYQNREVQVQDTWVDAQGRSWALIIDPLRPGANLSAEERLRPVNVPRSEVHHTSPFMYVGHLLFLYALLNEIDKDHYGLMLTVSPKGFYDLFYQNVGPNPPAGVTSNTLRGEQGSLAPGASARATRGNIFDSNLVSMYQRYWRLERAIAWRNLSRDSGLLWLQENRKVANRNQNIQPYTADVPLGINAADVVEYELRNSRVVDQDAAGNDIVEHDVFGQGTRREEPIGVLVPNGAMYRPYPTVFDLATFIAQLGASIVGALLTPEQQQEQFPQQQQLLMRTPAPIMNGSVPMLPSVPAIMGGVPAPVYNPFAPPQ